VYGWYHKDGKWGRKRWAPGNQQNLGEKLEKACLIPQKLVRGGGNHLLKHYRRLFPLLAPEKLKQEQREKIRERKRFGRGESDHRRAGLGREGGDVGTDGLGTLGGEVSVIVSRGDRDNDATHMGREEFGRRKKIKGRKGRGEKIPRSPS